MHKRKFIRLHLKISIAMGQSWTNRVHRMMLLCAVHLSLYFNCYADQGGKKVTLNVVNENCVRVFKQIEKQTKMSFFYSTSDISLPAKVTVKAVEKPLDEVMELILNGTGLEWVYTDNVITVRKKKEQGRYMESDGDSSITMLAVSGKVTDANGEAIPGATVLVKRTKDGVTTDADGKFALPKIRKNDVLTISSIGYETRELAVRGNTILAQLNLLVSKLDETVVIAYGTTTQRYNTGSVSTVKAEEISKQPVSNPLQALQGRVPGMMITQTTGTSGGGFVVRLRGQNSMQNGNDPLYIVDGVPYQSSFNTPVLAIITNTGNPLNHINPADIESIDILKDADATAIYGSRGANGVVLITTKKGKVGKSKLDLNVYTGIGKVNRFMKLLNTEQYLQMRREALSNDGVAPQPTDWDVNGTWDTTRYTDWQKKLIGGTAHLTDVQATLSGGTTIIQYLIGGGYHRETTVFPGKFSIQKGSVHFNLTSTSSSQKFKTVFSGSYYTDINRLPPNDLSADAINLPPNAPKLYKENGELNWENSTWTNPLVYTILKYKNQTRNLIGNATLSYTIINGLELKTSLGYNDLTQDQMINTPIKSYDPAFGITTGESTFGNTNIRTWLIEPQLAYGAQIGKGKLNFLAGATFQQTTNFFQSIWATGYTSDALLENPSFASSTPITFTKSQYRYSAVFGRLTYNLEDKYLLNLTCRRDGSSRFGPGRQFANFGAIGVGWIFSNESFISKNLPFLSYGKVRGSFGTTGNDQIEDYGYWDLYRGTSPYNYQGIQGLYAGTLFNPTYGWETNKKIEGAIELGFLKDRIFTTISHFRNRSSNQLVGYSLPRITGFGTIKGNLAATVQNTGWEFSINAQILKGQKFTWKSSINLTVPANKLVSFPGFETSSYSNIYTIGHSLNERKMFHFLGVDPETGLYQFADIKGERTYTPSFETDRISLVNISDQKFFGGFQNSFFFKNFQLDFLFQFVKQPGIVFLYNLMPGYLGFNQPIAVLDRWRKPGDISNIQRYNQDFSVYGGYETASNSDFAYGDASFIRLKNVSLSYQLSANFLQKIHLESGRVYLQGQNLLTFTKYKGWDPETRSSNTLPPLRVITAGIQITL